MSRFIRIMRCERGAVTIDWVVLTAAVLMIALVAADPIVVSVTSLMEVTADAVEASGVRLTTERLGEE